MKYVALGLLLFASGTCADGLAEVAEQVEAWYADDYGSHWLDAQTINPDVIRTYYVDDYRVHLLDGDSEIASNSAQWWRDFIDSEPAWLGSSIQHVKVVALTPRTATISAKWLNRYAGGETRSECNAYVVARTTSGSWQFTNVEFVRCEELGAPWDDVQGSGIRSP